jgi:hypothetical protein
VNRLQAGVPLTLPTTAMPFEFAASEPAGIEAIRLIVTPRQLVMNPTYDQPELPLQQAMAEEIIMTPGETGVQLAQAQPRYRGNTRGLTLQARHDVASASSYDQATYHDGQPGDAVIAETFIRVLPKPR